MKKMNQSFATVAFLAFLAALPAPAIAFPLGVTPAETLPRMRGWVSLKPSYSFALGQYNAAGELKSFATGESYTRVLVPLELRFGLFDWLEADCLLPVQSNRFANSITTNSGTSIGDLSLALKYKLLDEKESTSIFSAYAAAKLPTGKSEGASEAELTGTGSSDFSLGLLSQGDMGAFRFTGNFGYTMALEGSRRIATNPAEKRDYPDFLGYGLAGEYAFRDRFNASLEVMGMVGLTPLVLDGVTVHESEPNQLSITPGLNWSPSDGFELAGGFRIPLLGKASDSTVEPAYMGPVVAAHYFF